MNEQRILTGDIFLTKSDGFLSKQIVEWMWFYAKKHKIVIEKKNVFSHAGIFLQTDDGLKIAEAVKNGFKIRNFEEHYKIDEKYNCVLRPKMLWTKEEEWRIIQYIYYLAEINWGYQFWNFPQWMLYILLKLKTFDADSKKFMYCYEAVYRCLHEARDWSFTTNPEITDVFKLYDLTRFIKLKY